MLNKWMRRDYLGERNRKRTRGVLEFSRWVTERRGDCRSRSIWEGREKKTSEINTDQIKEEREIIVEN